MSKVAELIAAGKVPASTTGAVNQAGYPDGWPLFSDINVQVAYDWNYLPSDRVRVLKGNEAYRVALETMLTGKKPAATDGGASEVPAAAAAPVVSPEEAIINTPAAPDAVEEVVVPAEETVVEETAVPAEEPEGTVLEYPFGSLVKTKSGWEARVDNKDGSGVQRYVAKTKDELIGKLMQAQAHASVKIREQEAERIRLLADEPADLAQPRKRLQPRQMTAEEQFEFSEAINSGDPTRINKAFEKRDQIILGGSVNDVIGQVNETRDQLERDAYLATAKLFIKQHPEIKMSKELGDKMDEILAENGWAYTGRNLNKALAILKQAGEVETVSTPAEDDVVLPEPTNVAPAAAVVPAAAPKAAVVTKPTPPAATPTKAEARLRPASASTGISPRQASVRQGVVTSAPAVGLTAEEYNRMPISETRRRYKTDLGFKTAVDALIKEGKI
jgi:hypothetical protein